MARIPDGRKRKHESISASPDMEAPAISEGKGSQRQDGHLAHKPLGTTEQFSVTGNSGKEENLSKEIAEHLTVTHQNQAILEQNCTHMDSQRLKQTKKHGKNGIARKREISASVSTSHLKIEQDEAGSEQLHKLRAAVERLGGKLEDGWHVNSQRRSSTGLPFFIFISPTKERFRSRIDVVRHLGLPARPAKSRLLLSNQLALVPYNRRNKSLLKSSKARRTSGKPYLKSGKGHGRGGKPTTVQSKEVNGIQRTSTLSLSASVITQRCQDILRSIISTESFAALSNMVSPGASSTSMETTLQLKGPSFPACPLDLKLIHLRLSTGAYGQAPEMFSTDIQQVWKTIITAGNELVTLASSLAELSESLYKQQIRSLLDGFPKTTVNASNISNEQSFDDTYLHMPLPERVIARAADDTFLKEFPDIFVEDHCGVKTVPLTPNVTHSRLLKQLLSKTEATQPSHQLSNNMHKRAHEAEELLASQGRLSCNGVDSVCHKCEHNQDAECIVCNDCKAEYYPNCVLLTSIGGRWCCPLCLLNQATEKTWGTSSKGILDEETHEELLSISNAATKICNGFQVPTGKLGICEVCKRGDDNVLLCDACDAAYHMHCLSPSIDGVPDGAWYCPVCDEAGKSSMVFQQDTNVHSCAVCERVSRELNYAENESIAQVVSKGISPLYLASERNVDHGHPEHSLNQGVSENLNRVIQPDFVARNGVLCKVCRQGEGKKTILCSNCQNCYHWSCLEPALRKRPRKRWYCPSCLCRVCQIDVDDDKILLCDACDEGYHTYCLTPPLSEIPEEAWYCHSCTEAKANKAETKK